MHWSFRLHRGDDLSRSIAAFALEKGIKAAVAVCAVGCVTSFRLRDASGVRCREVSSPAEIVSLTGTVSQNGCHLHAAFALEDLSVWGGHLLDGCIVNTTAEIVLQEVENTLFSRQYDQATGYDELVITQV